jgi:hypothetical protein
MTHQFVPFLQAAKSKPADSSPETFSLLENLSTGSPSPGPEKNHAPRLELKRVGEEITEIRIYCSCGEIIQLKCEY